MQQNDLEIALKQCEISPCTLLSQMLHIHGIENLLRYTTMAIHEMLFAGTLQPPNRSMMYHQEYQWPWRAQVFLNIEHQSIIHLEEHVDSPIPPSLVRLQEHVSTGSGNAESSGKSDKDGGIFLAPRNHH